MTYCVIARDFTVKRHLSWVDNGVLQLPVEVWHRSRVSRQSRLEAWNIRESRMIENKKKINRAKIILSSRLATQLERLEIFDSSLEVFDSRGSSCEGRTTHIRVVLYVTDLLYFLQLIKIVKKAANVKKKKKKRKSPSRFNCLYDSYIAQWICFRFPHFVCLFCFFYLVTRKTLGQPWVTKTEFVHSISSRNVMSMVKNINLGITIWSNTRFSEQTGNFWEKNNINIFHKSIPFQ